MENGVLRIDLPLRTICCALVFCATSSVGLAQDRAGWRAQLEALTVFQGDTDLSKGGSFSSSRTFVRGSSIYSFDNDTSVGVSASFGLFDYDFGDAAQRPWDDIQDIRLSIPTRFRASETATVFLSPQVRWDYESGADRSDSTTYGIFGGVAWTISDSLTIGPAFGAYSQLEESGADVFPAILVDWDITKRWNLNTGAGLGATGGPGLTLGYKLSDTSQLSLSARSESVRFRLDDKGLAPDGVGEDESIPVVISYQYNPNPGLSLSAFVGAEFDGRLRLDDASGNQISSQSYDTAPLGGLAVRFRF
ncbi:hypothetical protein [Roseobacter denitrificans]|uniref:Uncharacterized protein n=1 Tax=Roseobacter denitrificans (strain ATCC 33942 / OCh 114) TaxID=375451 RepID=Q16AF0_ROSDO|nr:hypothetical protein [Roseobacter denitrificans]ABG31043.1 hypothetical protein RD1_1403 [Roseobacter denitrificans OCh 114]SFG33739.1 hypothetical protein SAMN05443635_113129 [Roseobacter denitrificans OCh 114]